MKFHVQRFRHKPDLGVYGDCWRTCIACLLDIDPEEIPHLHVEMESAGDWRVAEWLAKRGLTTACLPFPGDIDVDQVLACVSAANPGLRHMLVGKSRTGCSHIVIAQDGEIIHDPSQTQAGIVGPCDDGYWWVEFLGRRV